MGIRIVFRADQDAHPRVKLLQGVAKTVLKVLVDQGAGCEVPQAGELLLEFGGQSGRVNGGKMELGSGREGETVVDRVVGDILVESGRGAGLQEPVVSVDMSERGDRGSDAGSGGGVAGLEWENGTQVGVRERWLGVNGDAADAIERSGMYRHLDIDDVASQVFPWRCENWGIVDGIEIAGVLEDRLNTVVDGGVDLPEVEVAVDEGVGERW